MSQNRIELVITANSAGLQQGMQQATQEVEKLGRAADNTAQGMDRGFGTITAAAQRLLPLLGAAGLAGAVMGVARAGDAMTASLGRLQVATGSVQAAAQTYQDLYRISLQTGVAVTEAAGSFTRFSIAAREIGATREQVVDLVRTVQMAGIVAGSSTTETTAATMQLGQALASGRLQGDELRSIMENMPNLAEALARELGVNIGQLRKMGEEGKLTADVVFPALLRAGQNIRQQFEDMPVTMARAFGQLNAATNRFVAEMDRALRISQGIAAAAQLAANAMDRIRIATMPTPEERARSDADRANSSVNAARADVVAAQALLDQARENFLPRAGTSPDRALAAMRSADNDPQVQAAMRAVQVALERQRAAEAALERARLRVGQFEGNVPSEAIGQPTNDTSLSNRRNALGDGSALNDRLFPAEALRRDHARERQDILDRRNLGIIDTATAARQVAALDAELARKLAELNNRGAGGSEDRRPERLREQLAVLDASIEAEQRNTAAIEQGGVAMRNAEADQRAMQQAMQLFPQRGAEYERALVDLTEKHRRLAEVQAEGRLAQINFTDAMQRDQLALQGQLIGASAVERARRTAELQRSQELRRQGIDPDSDKGRASIAMSADLAEQRLEVERNQAAFGEIGRVGTQAFDRIGQAVTQGTLNMRDLGRIGQSVISELTQALFRLSVINPIRNMMGDNLPTASNVFGMLAKGIGGWFSGGGSSVSPVGAISAGMPYIPGISTGLHDGGIAGIEATFLRAVPPSLFHNAPRFHDGGFIGADEVPAILRRGEGVFTPEQMARLGPAGGINAPVTIYFSGNAGDPRDQAALAELVQRGIAAGIAQARPGIVGEAYGLVINDMKNNGPLAGMRRR